MQEHYPGPIHDTHNNKKEKRKTQYDTKKKKKKKRLLTHEQICLRFYSRITTILHEQNNIIIFIINLAYKLKKS